MSLSRGFWNFFWLVSQGSWTLRTMWDPVPPKFLLLLTYSLYHTLCFLSRVFSNFFEDFFFLLLFFSLDCIYIITYLFLFVNGFFSGAREFLGKFGTWYLYKLSIDKFVRLWYNGNSPSRGREGAGKTKRGLKPPFLSSFLNTHRRDKIHFLLG